MLLDVVKIYVKAGNGGNGCVSFHREKYVSHGGPDGGDGGNGGNVILRIDEGDNTLLRYKYSRKFVAENGGDGKSDKFHGKNGEDIILPVPPGTVLFISQYYHNFNICLDIYEIKFRQTKRASCSDAPDVMVK